MCARGSPSGGRQPALHHRDAGAGDRRRRVEVPPTLRALLAARLDQLEPPERRVLERGAVEGEVFHRGAVQALAPDETEVLPRLTALVRHELIRPERPQLPGEDALPLPPPADPRRRLRRPAEGRSRRPAPPLRRLARGQDGRSSSWTSSSATTSSRPPATRPSWADPTRARPPRRRSARGGGAARARQR